MIRARGRRLLLQARGTGVEDKGREGYEQEKGIEEDMSSDVWEHGGRGGHLF